jgi:hypothetical protein
MITGASQGLGRAFAEECAGRGMELVLIALPDTGLPDLARILRRAYEVRIEIIEMDLTDPEGPQKLAALARSHDFLVDTLVNNAGVGFMAPFSQSNTRQNETTIQLNVAALVRLTQEMLPALSERAHAWILNVASVGAFFPMPSMPVYSSTKGFVLSFSMLLREELRGTNVGVSVLCPNGIRTNRGTRQLIERQGWAGRLTCKYPDEVARAGIRGLLKGTGVIIPGLVNQALIRMSPLIPRSLYMRVISRRWGTGERATGALRQSPASGRVSEAAISNA